MRRSGLAQHRQPEAGQEIRAKRPEFSEKVGENRHFFLCFALTRPFGPYYNKGAAAAQAARSSGDFCTDGAAVRPHRPAQRMGPPAGSPCGRRTEDSARAGAATPAVLFPRRRKNKRKGPAPFRTLGGTTKHFLLSSRELFVSPAGASFFRRAPRRAAARQLFTIHDPLIDSTVLLNPRRPPLLPSVRAGRLTSVCAPPYGCGVPLQVLRPARFFFSCKEKKKRGTHDGQGGKSLPCRRKE